MTSEQVAKIRKDLEVVQANMDVFAEILNDLKPGSEKPADAELLEELNITCKEMQNRIADLLANVTSDELITQLLHINDELNNLFLRYARYKKNKEKTQLEEPEPSLIDFGTKPEEIVTDLQALGLNDGKRIVDPPVLPPTASQIPQEEDTELVMGHRQSDFDEMEAWLKANPGPMAGGAANAAPADRI